MGFKMTIGNYRVGQTIGEGMFAKVKLAVNVETNKNVAIKIIDKAMVRQKNLMDQVVREIKSMKILHHPNIVQIYEVIATRTKIYLVMEYVSGGQLSDKLYYLEKLDEEAARRYFQQLIDAVDYCHSRQIYHRDLKPENLLLDKNGNIKLSDFGLSILREPGELLTTSCGSPCYVAPEVVMHKSYDGAGSDIWSCGVILFEMLSGYVPFQDRSRTNLYRKISRAEYTFPEWFTPSQKRLISRILNPLPTKRATIAEILSDSWFQVDYKPSFGFEDESCTNSEEANSTLRERCLENGNPERFINAFELIAMSSDLDLSGFFQEEKKTMLGSKHPITETLEKIKVAAQEASLSFKKTDNSTVKLHDDPNLRRSRSNLTLSAEVVELTPMHCFVQISKSTGDLRIYKEFCRSLSSMLNGESGSLSDS
ncbi:CBL-interacting serine/threonine-protein kinase 21 [Rhynchospora pubera]|uniref:non-specific serine/threonine protein kinase n=1 Tax=Rhynchospora pubera TaxID=906938 RepID=A0AAV8CVN6_9POAL|nr:CBL-interacting serine/threonine-protein kinase 21 [Rhynchospora pubera]KAJ4758168.1 CBL-interacting serine/threonine-protein kinase 21 [Rhynchospora pubera]